MKRQSVKTTTSRRGLFVVGILVFVVAGYFTISVVSWNSYAADTDNRRSDIQSDLSDLTSMNGSVSQREQTTASLLQRIDAICRTPAYVAWQQYPVARVSRAVHDCKEANTAYYDAVQTFTDATTQQRDEIYFAKIIRETMEKDQTVSSESSEEHATIWEVAARQVRERQTGEAMQSIQLALQTALEALAAEWRTASSGQYGDILHAYDNLSNISGDVEDARQAVRGEVERRVRAVVR